jgi:transposase
LQTSTATGAAREQLGAQAHALMSVLNKQMGLSHGKVAWLFEKVFHLKIGRSTSVRSVERTGRRCEPAYEQIRQDVRAAEQVTPDETGWRVGGHKAWLHAFATPRTTCYDIDPTRSIAPAKRLLGLDWSGWLVHDGWSVYDQFTRAIHQQCNTHLLHRCHELLEVARGGAARFPQTLKDLLQKGLTTRDHYEQGVISAHGLWTAAGRLTTQLDRLVQGPVCGLPQAGSPRNSIGWCKDGSGIRAIVAWQNSWRDIWTRSWLTSGTRAWMPRTIKENNLFGPP